MGATASGGRDGTKPKTKRRWRTPPPLLQDGEGPGPEGLAVLDEFPNELGVVLWKSLRSVLLWADEEASSRSKLFDEGAAERRRAEIAVALSENGEPIRESLEELVSVLEKPESADPGKIANALTYLGQWARQKEAPGTALELLQVAAVTKPSDPKLALAVGRAARDLTKYGRAEAWLYRAVGLARQAREWRIYVDAYVGHGTMMFRRGALPAARRSFLKALRRARRQGFREGEARALHDLFVLEHRAGNAAQALVYAEEAVDAHRPHHPGLARLAHDIAYHWLERGEAARALPVLLEMLNKAPEDARPAGLGSIARAAAVTGDPEAFAWARAGLAEMNPRPGLAEAWVDVARGALALDRYEEAEEAARLAESIARARREGQMRFLAEEIMGEIRGEREAAADEVAEESPPARETGNRIARDLIRSLQRAPAPETEKPA